ncbi:Bystin [Artemisia annua]|uniref:Bystin n=1 Tax=Artemisia annua TaxID=35608 RepID=A0A2U1Q472_ARTAN|nr:Bystin [Artemisia annua]
MAAKMEYGGTTSYFIKLLVEKKYALSYRVVDAMVSHFMRFCEDFRYNYELTVEQKDAIGYLLKKQRHKLVTPEILRELQSSRNHGEKEDDRSLKIFELRGAVGTGFNISSGEDIEATGAENDYEIAYILH